MVQKCTGLLRASAGTPMRSLGSSLVLDHVLSSVISSPAPYAIALTRPRKDIALTNQYTTQCDPIISAARSRRQVEATKVHKPTTNDFNGPIAAGAFWRFLISPE
ncbi:hypothetical protein N7540_007613 [Penicillium herquei]|nr:hypothetical protein N7540_007613 [Penicillium herquei]